MGTTKIRKGPFSFPVFFHIAIFGNAALGKYQASHMLIIGKNPDEPEGTERDLCFSSSISTLYIRGRRAISKSLTAHFLSLTKDQIIHRIQMVGLKRPSVSVKAILWLLKNDYIDMDPAELENFIGLAEKESPEEYLADMLTLSIKHRGRYPMTEEECDTLVEIRKSIAAGNEPVLTDSTVPLPDSSENDTVETTASENGTMENNTVETTTSDKTVPDIIASETISPDKIKENTPIQSEQETTNSVSKSQITEELDQTETSQSMPGNEQSPSSSELEKAFATIRAANDSILQEVNEKEELLKEANAKYHDQRMVTMQTEKNLRDLKTKKHLAEQAFQEAVARRDALTQQLRASELELQRLYQRIADSSEQDRIMRAALQQLTKELESGPDLSSSIASKPGSSEIRSSYTLHELFYEKDREAYRSNYIRIQGDHIGYALTDQEVRMSTDLFRRSLKTYLIDFTGSLAGLTDTVLHHAEYRQCLQIVLICVIPSEKSINRLKNILINMVKFALTDDGHLFVAWSTNDKLQPEDYVARAVISIQSPSKAELLRQQLLIQPPIIHLSPAKYYEDRVPDFLLPMQTPLPNSGSYDISDRENIDIED